MGELMISACILLLMLTGIGVMIAYGVAWWKQVLAVLGFIVGLYAIALAAIFLRKER